MHKLAAVETMVEVALAKTEEVGSPRVVGMHFVINESGHVSEESVRLCFDIAAQGTPAEGVELFAWNLPRYQCFHCGNIFEGSHSDDSAVPCSECGESVLMVPPPEEFYLDSIDVE